MVGSRRSSPSLGRQPHRHRTGSTPGEHRLHRRGGDLERRSGREPGHQRGAVASAQPPPPPGMGHQRGAADRHRRSHHRARPAGPPWSIARHAGHQGAQRGRQRSHRGPPLGVVVAGLVGEGQRRSHDRRGVALISAPPADSIERDGLGSEVRGEVAEQRADGGDVVGRSGWSASAVEASAEAAQHRSAIGTEQHVAGLEAPVHHPGGVDPVERRSDVGQHRHRRHRRQADVDERATTDPAGGPPGGRLGDGRQQLHHPRALRRLQPGELSGDGRIALDRGRAPHHHRGPVEGGEEGPDGRGRAGVGRGERSGQRHDGSNPIPLPLATGAPHLAHPVGGSGMLAPWKRAARIRSRCLGGTVHQRARRRSPGASR